MRTTTTTTIAAVFLAASFPLLIAAQEPAGTPCAGVAGGKSCGPTQCCTAQQECVVENSLIGEPIYECVPGVESSVIPLPTISPSVPLATSTVLSTSVSVSTATATSNSVSASASGSATVTAPDSTMASSKVETTRAATGSDAAPSPTGGDEDSGSGADGVWTKGTGAVAGLVAVAAVVVGWM